MARKSSLPHRAGANALGVLFALIWVFPVYWLLNSAFSPESALQSRTPSFFPAPFTLEHFQSILADSAFYFALRISFFTALVVVPAAIVFVFFTSVALSRFRFRGRRSLIVAVLVIQMIPAEALFISQYKMIDGCSRMGAFFRVTFPLLGSGISSALLVYGVLLGADGYAGEPGEMGHARIVPIGDRQTITRLRTAGRLLGQTLCTVVNFINPSLVVPGGGLSQAEPYVAAIRSQLYAGCHPLATKDLLVE